MSDQKRLGVPLRFDPVPGRGINKFMKRGPDPVPAYNREKLEQSASEQPKDEYDELLKNIKQEFNDSDTHGTPRRVRAASAILSFSRGVPDITMKELGTMQLKREQLVLKAVKALDDGFREEAVAVFSGLQSLRFAEERVLGAVIGLRKRQKSLRALEKREKRVSVAKREVKRANSERDAAIKERDAATKERDAMARAIALHKGADR